MRYLNRLIRRATGLARKNTLGPVACNWNDLINPYENTVVSFSSRPDTTVHPKFEPRETLKKVPASPLKQRVHQDDRVETRSFEKKETARLEKADTTRLKSPVPLKEDKRGSIIPLQEDHAHKKDLRQPQAPVPDRRSSRAHKKQDTPSVNPARYYTIKNERKKPSAVKKDKPLFFKKIAEKGMDIGRFVKISPEVGRKEKEEQPVTKNESILLTRRHQVEFTKNAFPAEKRRRRKKTPKKDEKSPRLIIGNLKVDVLPAVNTIKSPRPASETRRNQGKSSGRGMNRQVTKMGFGLGQM